MTFSQDEEAASSGGQDEPRAESISALLAITERIFDDERQRGATLSTKASTLAGFSGTILAIETGLGRYIFGMDLGGVGDPTVRVLFMVSVIALATAVTLAIGGVLRTQERLLVEAEQVAAFAGPPWIHTPVVDIEGEMLASLGRALATERAMNDRRASFTDYAAIALLGGLLTVAGQALVLALDELIY